MTKHCRTFLVKDITQVTSSKMKLTSLISLIGHLVHTMDTHILIRCSMNVFPGSVVAQQKLAQELKQLKESLLHAEAHFQQHLKDMAQVCMFLTVVHSWRVQTVSTIKAFVSCNAPNVRETFSYLYTHIHILRLCVDSYLGNKCFTMESSVNKCFIIPYGEKTISAYYAVW